eukprot:3882700-Pyramimonas_sp.AAC.1
MSVTCNHPEQSEAHPSATPSVHPDFSHYYRQQQLCSEADWAQTEALLCAPLPLSVRLNRSSGVAARTAEHLRRRIGSMRSIPWLACDLAWQVAADQPP